MSSNGENLHHFKELKTILHHFENDLVYGFQEMLDWLLERGGTKVN